MISRGAVASVAIAIALLGGVIAACADRAPPQSPASGEGPPQRATSAPPRAEAAPSSPADGPRFDCKGPVPSCKYEEPCPGDMTCAGNGNFACGDTPALGRPCPPGTCELEGEEVASRACLPIGCCEEVENLPEVPGCEPEQTRARFEILRDGHRDEWTSCVVDSSGSDTVEMAFVDGTKVVYAFPTEYAPGIGEPKAIRGFLRPPASRFDGAVVVLGAGATSEQNQHGQWRISAPAAHAVARSGGAPVAGNVSYDDKEFRATKHDYGSVDGVRLDVHEILAMSCGQRQESGYSCGIFMGTNAAPTWIFIRLGEKDELVDAFVARYDASGVDVFVASRGGKDATSRVEVGGFGRLPRVDDAAPGNAVVRITVDQ